MRDVLDEGIARLKRSREASLEIQLDIRRLETEVEENIEAEEMALKKMEDMKPDVEDQVCGNWITRREIWRKTSG